MSLLVSALRDVDASFSTRHTTNKISTNCSVYSRKCFENDKNSFSCPPGIFRAQIQFLGRTSRQHCRETGCELTVGGADTTGSSDCRLDFKANNSELFPPVDAITTAHSNFKYCHLVAVGAKSCCCIPRRCSTECYKEQHIEQSHDV